MKNKNKQSVGYVMNDRAVMEFGQRVMPPWIGGIQSQRCGQAYAIRGNWIPAIPAGMTVSMRKLMYCPLVRLRGLMYGN
jgi:hypothetical protein